MPSHMSFQKRIVAMTRLHETSRSNTALIALRHPTKYKLITTFTLYIILYIYASHRCRQTQHVVSARRKSNGIAEPNTLQTKSTNSEICKQFIAICYRRNLDIFVQKQPTKNLDALDGLDTSRSKAQKPHPGSFHCGIEMTQIS